MTDTKDLDPIVAELRQARLDSGFKQHQMADLLGLGSSRLSSYENGAASPQLSVLRFWTRKLNREVVLTGGDQSSANGSVKIELTRYQIALAMGMLIAESRRNDSGSTLFNDLEQIANALSRAL